MSLKIYNRDAQQWEKNGTMIANSIKVVDLEGNYTSQNVNGCLKELADNISQMKKDIQYIYENGTIGNGPGGGGPGASVPVITINSAMVGTTALTNKNTDTTSVTLQYEANSDDTIDITYTFTSPNPGTGIVYLSTGTDNKQLTISQGKNKWTVGPFAKGTHNLSITVSDKQGFWSNPAQIVIISGSLEIQSSFSDSVDFTVFNDVVIPYTVSTQLASNVYLYYTLRGVDQTPILVSKTTTNNLNIGKLLMGLNELQMWLVTDDGKYKSNILKYSLIAADSQNLVMSSTFDKNSIEVGKDILIDYRVSMLNQYSFVTDYYVDGNKLTTVTSYPGVNYWDVGNNLPLGIHTFVITTKTVDGQHSYTLNFTIEVVSVGYVPYQHITQDEVGNNILLAAYDATGKMNGSVDQTTWKDLSPNNVSCTLYNFNYTTNGWMDNSLQFSGLSYAVIDLAPFKNGIKQGFTVEILCKIKDVGNPQARILSCKNPLSPYQGFEIYTDTATMSSSTGNTVGVTIQDDVWTRISFVVDRKEKLMYTYVNGIISSVSELSDQIMDISAPNYSDEFSYNGKIYIGGCLDENGKITNNSVSTIKNIYIYNTVLSDTQIVHNFIADKNDQDEQLRLRALNPDISINNAGMPTMNIQGNLSSMNENDERTCTITYSDPNNPKKTFTKDGCGVSWQGTSSKSYPVKNWTIKLVNGGTPWLSYTPNDNWLSEERWTLKASYMDSSNANNIGLQKFITDFFIDNPYYQTIYIDPKARANVDGFPVRLMINGEDAGIVTWNIDRYAYHNYGFITYDNNWNITRHPTAVSYEINVNGTDGAAAFRNKSFDDPNGIRFEWKHRYNFRGDTDKVCDTVRINTGAIVQVLAEEQHPELVNMVTWVHDSTDDEFRQNLGSHFSVSHLIDYYLIAYVFGMVDNLGKNMVFTCFGKDANSNYIWYPSFYDCDSVMGLDNMGHLKFDAGLDMTDDDGQYIAGDYNTSNSLLWVKLRTNFAAQIAERYYELRSSNRKDAAGNLLPPVFSYENIMKYLGGQVMDNLGQNYYNLDAHIKYIDSKDPETGVRDRTQWWWMCNGNRREFTERWLKERFYYMDSVFNFNESVTSGPGAQIIIRTNTIGTYTLRMKTASPAWVLVKFSDSTSTWINHKVRKDNNSSNSHYFDDEGYVIFTAEVSNAKDNNIEIYCADVITHLEGVKDCNAGSINIGYASRLTALDVSGSSQITELDLQNNPNLQSLKCYNCPLLGTVPTGTTLDLRGCENLTELDCNHTALQSILFNQTGGVLQNLNVSYSKITSFVLNGQLYLTSLSLNGCNALSTLSITKCNGIQSINMADTILQNVTVNECANLQSIDLSRTRYLTSLNLNMCPNLSTLILAGVSSSAMTELDLQTVLNLTTLDISSCGYFKTITFGQYTDSNGVLKNYNKLTTLKCAGSVIKSIRFGTANAAPSYLDLSPFALTAIDFNGCTNLTDIRGINVTVTNGAPFYGCTNLTSIQGTVKLIGSSTRAFYNCYNLTNLPTLDLSQLTSISETFAFCNKFTWANVQQIMLSSGITSSFTGGWRMFYCCTGITGAIPSNIFSKCSGVTSLSEVFNGCTNINGSITTAHFYANGTTTSYMPNLNTLYYAFANTGINGTIPVDLLRYNTKLDSVERMFYNTKITGIDNIDNLLYYNTTLRYAYGMFQSCSLLVASPTDNMFAHNTSLLGVGAFFQNCPKVYGTIPRGIFTNIGGSLATSNQLTDVSYFFSGCTGITGTIPAYNSDSDQGLLDKSPNLTTINYLFSGCTGLTGSIPTDFLKNNKKLQRADALFNGCTGLTGEIPPNLFKGQRSLWNLSSVFAGCNGLYSTIPIGFLNDCTSLTDVSYMFSGCSKLYGQIPERISTFVLTEDPPGSGIWVNKENVSQYGLLDNCANLINIAGLFQNCSGLRSTIPSTLLINAKKVTNASYLFYRCFYITGSIPAQLFQNCISLQYLNNAFQDCVGLVNPAGFSNADYSNPDSPNYNITYAFDPTTFQNCGALIDVNNMFSMWGSGLPNSSQLNGVLHKDLFKNCSKLVNLSTFLASCSNITGTLDSTLFDGCPSLNNLYYAFNGTNITSIGSSFLYKCTLMNNMDYTFNGCSSLTGVVPAYWDKTCPLTRVTTHKGTFHGIPAAVITNSGVPIDWQ